MDEQHANIRHVGEPAEGVEFRGFAHLVWPLRIEGTLDECKDRMRQLMGELDEVLNRHEWVWALDGRSALGAMEETARVLLAHEERQAARRARDQ